MTQLLEPLPAETQTELADFLRRHAEECARLADGQAAPLATELRALADMLHERALRLERCAAQAQDAAGEAAS